jgi:hypothetical protein
MGEPVVFLVAPAEVGRHSREELRAERELPVRETAVEPVWRITRVPVVVVVVETMLVKTPLTLQLVALEVLEHLLP